MADASLPLWERPQLRAAAGTTLRPGGFSLTDRAADWIGMLPGWRVLDVGCGLGASVKRFRSRYGASAWGVEPSARQIEQAGKMKGLVRAYGDQLPFRSGVFDALFCECVFSLFDDRPGGLREWHRVLGPSGFLVLSDLYASQPCDGQPLQSSSCADRAMLLEDTRKMVEASGFTVQLLEDHSHHLKALAGKLIFAADAENVATGLCCGAGQGGGLGYYLMIAQKQGGAGV